MSSVFKTLPLSRQHSFVCSAGSKGYHAMKEMLQNGIPGHTLLIESGDLRDVGGESYRGGVACCRSFTINPTAAYFRHIPFNDYIPVEITHIRVFSDLRLLPLDFLKNSRLCDIDLTPISQLEKGVQGPFLQGCKGLSHIDLSPFLRVASTGRSFLQGCSGLMAIHLTPLSHVTDIQASFLHGCSGLTTIDLSPLLHLRTVGHFFLKGCSSLTEIDLSPLSRIEVVQEGFLHGCNELAIIDLSPLTQVMTIGASFLEECSGLITIEIGCLAEVSQVRAVGHSFLKGCLSLTMVDLRVLSGVALLLRDFLHGCTGLTTIDFSHITSLHSFPLELRARPGVVLILPDHLKK
jgi:hypothetical protein